MPREMPQGTVTILFTDVVDSTALATSRGDAPAHAILQHERELVRNQIEEHAGHEVKTMGDGFMVAFSSAREAVGCAIGIQRSLAQYAREDPAAVLQVRIGLNTGEAISEGEDLFGAAVNAAARVMHKASGGEILISEPVRAVLGTSSEHRLADRGRFRLKGFPERWHLYEVIWRDEAAAPAPPPAEGLPFVRRERELARLTQSLDRASRGHGSMVLITGDAGVGKTRLAEECAASARRRGLHAFAGHCYEDAGGPPYAPFVEIVEAIAHALPPAVLKSALDAPAAPVSGLSPSLERLLAPAAAETEPSAFEKPELFNALRVFLDRLSSTEPLLLLVDDVQWADVHSLQLLRFLARGLDQMRLVIIATHREDALDARAPVAQALHELHAKHYATDIELDPFDVDAVAALLEAASGRRAPTAIAQMLHRETSGNAFFIEELYRHLADGGELFDGSGAWLPSSRVDRTALPKGLRFVIEGRLARLSGPTREMLNAAAVLGTAFETDILRAVSAGAGDELWDCLDEAERARIVVPEDEGAEGRFRFVHPLVRSAVIASLPAMQRQGLHARAAAALEPRAKNAGAVAELAHHYNSAGPLADPELAIAALQRAGETALGAYANAEAASHFESAIRLHARLSAGSKAELADLVHHLGQAQYRFGDWAGSAATLDRALALYREAREVRNQARVLYSKASLATFASRPTDALTFLEDAGALAPDDNALRGLILQLTSQNLVDLRRYDEAAKAAAEALAVGDALGNAYVRNRARIASGYCALATLDMERAADDFSRVADAPTAPPHERMAAESRRAIALACLGSLDEAEERGGRAREYFRSMRDAAESLAELSTERDPYEFGLSCVSEAVSAIVHGRLPEVERFLREAIAACGEPPNLRVVRTLTPMLVQTQHYLGLYDEASASLQTFAPSIGGHQPAFARLYMVLDAAARQGEDPFAGERPLARSVAPDIGSLGVTMLAAETAIAFRDADAAGTHLDVLEHLHEQGTVFSTGWVALVARLLGAVYTLVGSQLRAGSVLDAALAGARARGAAAEVAFVRLEIAELHAARGDLAAARAELADADGCLSALGIRCRDARVTALRKALGRDDLPAASLSESEAHLLRLIAAGRTNSEIARACALAEHEVQRQVRALYARIGVRNRAAAIAYAYRTKVISDGE